MSLVGTIHVFLDTRLGKERDESSNNQRGTDCHSMIGMCCLRAQESVTSPERILFDTNMSFQNIRLRYPLSLVDRLIPSGASDTSVEPV